MHYLNVCIKTSFSKLKLIKIYVHQGWKQANRNIKKNALRFKIKLSFSEWSNFKSSNIFSYTSSQCLIVNVLIYVPVRGWI